MGTWTTALHIPIRPGVKVPNPTLPTLPKHSLLVRCRMRKRRGASKGSIKCRKLEVQLAESTPKGGHPLQVVYEGK